MLESVPAHSLESIESPFDAFRDSLWTVSPVAGLSVDEMSAGSPCSVQALVTVFPAR